MFEVPTVFTDCTNEPNNQTALITRIISYHCTFVVYGIVECLLSEHQISELAGKIHKFTVIIDCRLPYA